MKGNIIDIERFAIHDGPGIRSTVFLKGCPLHCLWCQNPEGIKDEINLWYFEKKCIRCHRCINACRNKAITIGKKDEPHILIDRDKCTKRADCTHICPTNALVFDGRNLSSEEVVKILLGDKKFYKNSNGGITISGGDPFYQYKFSIEILKSCKKEKIHTAIETCLYTKKRIIDEFIGIVDLFIIDLKIFDSELHKKYTGKDNVIIKSNFKYLSTNGVKILIRIPLIPNITATNINLRGIARFVNEVNSDIPIELINYNPLCKSKYKLMGISDDFFKSMKPFKEDEITDFYKIIESENVKTLREADIKE